MCELLVRARHTLTGNTETDKGVWRRGDVIVIEEDGYAWGIQELKANWLAVGNTSATWHKNTFMVKVTGVPKSKAVLIPDNISVDEDDGFGNIISVLKINRRRFNYVAVDATPQQIKNAIGSDYEITVTPTQIKNFLRNKDTDTELALGL